MKLPSRSFLRAGVAQQAGLAFVATMVPNVFFFVYHFFMSRQLGVEKYGALSSVISLLILASLPAGIAATVIAKFAAEFRALDDLDHLSSLYQKALRIATVFGGAVLVAGILASGSLQNYLHLAQRSIVVFTAYIVAVTYIVSVCRAMLQGMQDYASLAISTSIDAMGRAVLGIGFVTIGWGLSGAVLGLSAAASLSLLYSFWATGRQLKRGVAPIRVDLRRLTQSTAGIALSGFCVTMLGYVDQPMVKHFLSEQDAGIYGVVSLCGKVLLYALAFLPILVLPKATARSTRGESQHYVIVAIFVFLGAIAAPGLLALGLAPHIIVKIMAGGAYAAAAPYLLSYGAAMVFLAGSIAFSNINIGTHRFYYLAPLAAVTAGEVVAIQTYHNGIGQVILVVLIANALGFVSTASVALVPGIVRIRPRIIDVPSTGTI